MKTAPDEITQEYESIRIGTAPKRKAICMLHERVRSLIHRYTSEPEKDRRLLDKAQNIIAQLQSALIVTDDVSYTLFYLYDYCYLQLENDDRGSIVNAYSIITELADSFHSLLTQPRPHSQ
jgi:flagellin-specific chaperone FliS